MCLQNSHHCAVHRDSLCCGTEMQGGEVKCIVLVFSSCLSFVGVLIYPYSILLIIAAS